ncbi:MAG: putative DNA modification/repair radical SAM protein [Chloroflexi bacterium]|nr:putative DNA modification/repair radical SAM protein [Chloroflexota bacterium]
MLIKSTPDVYEKLRHLGGMATDDILSPAERSDGTTRPSGGGERVGPRGGVTPHAGVYKAAMPNGKRISLMRVMFTDHCIMDCHYCPNSHWVPRRRYGFKVDELARLFNEMHQRHMGDGLFLSSGIFKNPNATQERLLDVVDAVRSRYGFRGYVHLKVMPGTNDDSLLEASQRLGARLSINIESPSAEHLRKVSKMKDFDKGIIEPMGRISDLMQERYGGAVGQATQMVVGAADESDWDIYNRMTSLYGNYGFKRVYYSAFRPVRHTPLEEHPATPPVREHRLYQLDWLSRIYGYDSEELRPAFDTSGFLELRADPKMMIAVNDFERFPVDVNRASERDLLRVPGVGPLAASRIMRQRGEHSITRPQELQAMGVVLKRAMPFLRFPGHKPSPARQGELDLFPDPTPTPSRTMDLHAAHAASGCATCPLNPGTCGMAA